jgi:hypothetical protein
MNLGNHISECLEKYKNGHSKLNEKALSMEGMVGAGARNLLNLLVGFEKCRYMQIGTWKGACLYSALYNNNIEYAFACDNFCQYSAGHGCSFLQDGKIVSQTNLVKDVMLRFMQPEEDEEILEFEFYDGDCFGMPLKKVERPINVYFYDGGHSLADHFMSLYYFYPVLANEFIFICDDWPEESVQNGTMAAIEYCNYTIKEQHVHENLFIAHLVKDLSWAIMKSLDIRGAKPTEKCKLDNKGIYTERIR